MKDEGKYSDFSYFSTLARNMEEYWQSNEIWRRLIFLPSGPDATDGLAEM